jgi:hypothetical protein
VFQFHLTPEALLTAFTSTWLHIKKPPPDSLPDFFEHTLSILLPPLLHSGSASLSFLLGDCVFAFIFFGKRVEARWTALLAFKTVKATPASASAKLFDYIFVT